MRWGVGWIAAWLLAFALCLPAAGLASAADGELVVSADQPGSLGVVVVAQPDGPDQEPGSNLRLVGRESSEQVDAVVIALWSIAAGMSVMLVVFLWHTSPRRRLRLARSREAQLAEQAEAAEAASESEQAGEAGGPDREPEASAEPRSMVELAASAPKPSVEPAARGAPEATEEAGSVETEPTEADERSERGPEPAGEAGAQPGQAFWPRLRHLLGLD